MWSFIVIHDYESTFENFISLEIYIKTYGKIVIDKLPCKVNKNSYKTVFIYDNYEINIIQIFRDTYKFTIYDTMKYPDGVPGLKFGCELETCLDLTDTKLSQDEIDNKLNLLRNDLIEEKHVSIWSELIIKYIQDVIIPNISEEFIEVFPIIYIAHNPKTGYVDYQIDVSNGGIKKVDLPNHNKYLTFTRDMSLKCNDTSVDKYIVKNTIHCEIVSPTLRGYDDINLLYQNIINKKYMYSNTSTSFHVNISFRKDIYFSEGLISCILENFKEYEENKYRIDDAGNETKYANRVFESAIKNILESYGHMIYYGNNVNNIFNYENFIENERYYRSYITLNEKYNSLYLKNPAIIEFRLFSSSSTTKKLLSYIDTSIKLIEDAYYNYINNMDIIIDDLQKINLKACIDYTPIKSYIGNLYTYIEEHFPKLEVINSYKIHDLEKGLILLFSKKRQEVNNLVRLEGNVYIFDTYSLYDNKTYKYQMTEDNYIFTIKLHSITF